MTSSRTAQFTLALALSLAVHGAVYMLWPVRPDTVPLASGEALKVSLLVSQHAVEPATVETPAAVTAKSKQVEIQKTPAASRPRHVETTRPAVTKITTSHAHDPAPTSADNNEPQAVPTTTQQHVSTSASKPATISADSRKHIQKYLHDEFQRYFYYPHLAIKRGWQGEVQIGLRIEANGTLSRIRVLRGSGYNLLDNAATKSLARVEALPAAVSLLGGSSLDVILPVEYRLL